MRKRQSKKRVRRMIKQKLMALLLIGISVVSIYASKGDATFAAFGVPLGLYILFTKECFVR